MATKKGMTTKQFVKAYSGAPWDHETCASRATEVIDGDLAEKGQAFLDAKVEFERALVNAGFEWG